MNALELAELTKHGLDMIEKIVKLIADAHAGAVKPKEALDRIGKLHDQIAADRAAADKALHDKFDKG